MAAPRLPRRIHFNWGGGEEKNKTRLHDFAFLLLKYNNNSEKLEKADAESYWGVVQ